MKSLSDIIFKTYCNYRSSTIYGKSGIIPIPFDSEIYDVENENKFMIRNFNFSKNLKHETFNPAYLIPIHLGIDKTSFGAYLKSIDKKINSYGYLFASSLLISNSICNLISK